jgi:dihydropteroate synthase
LSKLEEKLAAQPFGLREIGPGIGRYIRGYDTPALTLACGRTELDLSHKTHVMGIVNCTPDSFSGDGFGQSGKPDPDAVAAYAQTIAEQGASIIAKAANPLAWIHAGHRERRDSPGNPRDPRDL